MIKTRSHPFVDAYSRGYSLREIALEHEVSQNSVRKILAQHHVSLRRPGRHDEQLTPEQIEPTQSGTEFDPPGTDFRWRSHAEARRCN
jgi:hypothetical protein